MWRFRAGPCVIGLMAVAAGRGCYSSVAPVPKIDPGVVDSGLPYEEPPPDAACGPRKPWEGPGVTGVLPMSATGALVLNGDRYFVADFDTSGADASDPTLGSVLAWRETGALKDLWADAPPVFGQQPWDDPGVTAVYVTKTTGAQVIVSRFRRWVRSGSEWPLVGSVLDDWLVDDAGPPPLDGQVPWLGAGVTATYFTPGGASFYAISQDKAWVRSTSDPDPRNWRWADAGFYLAQRPEWSNAPLVAGRRPYDSPGVTAAYYVGPKLFVLSVDKMWISNGSTWLASGNLEGMPGWSSAPTAACPR